MCRTTLLLTSRLTPCWVEGEYNAPENANITDLPYRHALSFVSLLPAFWQTSCWQGHYRVAEIIVQQITAKCSSLPSNSSVSANPKSWGPLQAASQILRKASGSVASNMTTAFKIIALDVILHSRQWKASTVILSLCKTLIPLKLSSNPWHKLDGELIYKWENLICTSET